MIAGCSNEVITPYVPTDIAITQTTDFLEGQTFNSSNFSVKVKYLYESDYKDIPASILVFNDNDDNGVVSYGDTVTASAGTDPYENPVEKEATINVYAIQYITAEAAKESYAYAAGFKPAPTDITVTAHYSDGKTLVLGPDDYTVKVNAVPGTEETFKGTFDVTLSNNLMNNGTTPPAGAQFTVDVTFTQTLSDIVIDGITSVIGYTGATSFKPLELDYEDVADFEEYNPIDLSKVWVRVSGTDAAGEPLTEVNNAFAASEIPGLAFEYVNNNTTRPLFDNVDKVNFATDSNADKPAIVAVYNEEILADKKLQVQLETPEVVVQYSGDGILGGTKNTGLTKADFRVYLVVDGVSTDITDQVELTDFFFISNGDNEQLKSDTFSEASNYVGVTYRGVSTTGDNKATVEFVSPYVDYTLSDLTIKFREGFALDPLFYPEGRVMELVKGGIESITATRTNADGTTAEVTIDIDDPDLTIRLATGSTPEAADYDYEDALTALYVGAIYEYGAETTVSTLTSQQVTVNKTAEITSVEFVPEYAENPAVGDPITWKLTVNGNGGIIKESEAFSPVATSTEAQGMTLNFRYFIDGVEIKTAAYGSAFIPTAIGEDAVENIIIKVNGVNSEAVSIDGGRWYVAPDLSDLKASATAEYLAEAYIGEEISTNEDDYQIDESSIATAFGVDDIADIPAEYIPEIVDVITDVPAAKIVDGVDANSVTLVISYVDKNGDAQTAELSAEFTGASWYKAPEAGLTLTIGTGDDQRSIGPGTTSSKPFDVPNYVTYASSDFINNLDKVGKGTVNELVSYTAERVSGSPNIVTADDGSVTSIYLGNEGVVRITVAYPTNPGEDAGTATFYIG